MSKRNHLVGLAAVFALAGGSVIGAVQQRPDVRCCGASFDSFERSDGLNQQLTGTYQLERRRGEDPARAVEHAVRVLPSAERQGAARRLMNRLHAPETIAIDRNGNNVTIASSRGQRTTVEADGRERTERGDAGRPVSTRATLDGDQLVMTTTGTAGHDFAVTFELLDGGRSLRVTRRIDDESLREPVSVQSFYRRSSDQAEWDVYAPTRSARTQTDGGGADTVIGHGINEGERRAAR